jgi:GTP-binding protein HflX
MDFGVQLARARSQLKRVRKARKERALLIGLEKEASRNGTCRIRSQNCELANSAGARLLIRSRKNCKPTAPYISRGKPIDQDSCRIDKLHRSSSTMNIAPQGGTWNLFAKARSHRAHLVFSRSAQQPEAAFRQAAQLQYLLPRLTRMWHHLSRQTGGIGTRGPGETQLEVDRRRVQERIARLERELEAVRKTRAVQRQGRKRHQWPVAAVVGYTNAGKSTLLNLLTGADVVIEDKLFATLDPTTRSLVLPNKQRVLLTDTVGFLRKLPHTLIESFKATLEEVSEADLLVHIVDLSHPRVDEQMEAVDAVIKELDAFGKQTLIVFNKIDNLENRELAEIYVNRFPGSVAISAHTGEGVSKLVQALETALDWRLRFWIRPINQRFTPGYRVSHKCRVAL